MNILDNIKGSPVRSERVYAGPSLGWIEAPIYQDTIITGDYTVQPWQSVILCNLSAPATVTLPNLTTWLNQGYSGWGGIFVKDVAGNAGANNVTISPVAGATINGLATYTIAANRAGILIRPRSDYAGWYTL